MVGLEAEMFTADVVTLSGGRRRRFLVCFQRRHAAPKVRSIFNPFPSNPAAMNMSIDWDNIQVASPCNARWEDMAGDERARFCGPCRKNVFNLSAMTRTQIETLIREKEGKLCGRFYQRPDGRMITADCPTGQRRRRNRLMRWGGAMFATVLLILGVRTTGRAQDKSKPGTPKGDLTRLMGEVSVAPVRMGDIAVPHSAVTNREAMIMGKIALPLPAVTNKVSVLTNCPAPNQGRVVMGFVALPVRTNRTSQPANPK